MSRMDSKSQGHPWLAEPSRAQMLGLPTAGGLQGEEGQPWQGT